MAGIQSKIGVGTEDYLVTEGVGSVSSIDANDTISSGFRNLGSLTSVNFSHDITELEIKETMTGNGLTTASLVTDKNVEVTLTFKNFSVENYELFTLGNITTVAGAPATETNVTAYVNAEGDASYGIFNGGRLIDASTLVITDNATGAITYEEGKNYEADGAGYAIYSVADQTAKGAANIINDSDALDFAYTLEAQKKVQAFQKNSIEKFFSFNGINKITGENISVIIPKLSINPSDGIEFLSPDAEGTTTITAKALTSKAYPDSAPYSISKKD